MTGALLQLVAYGAQDIYTTGNPQITFFRTVYRRHTNFAIESIQNGFTGAPHFGSKVTATIARNGDLLSRTYVRIVLSGGTAPGDAKWAWVKDLGNAIIESAELNIGGQTIDKHYGTWMHIWHDLTRVPGQDRGYDNLTGNTEALTTLATSHDETVLYVPLQFFFCRHIGLSLALISLQYHDVKIDIKFEAARNLIITSGFSSSNPADELGLSIVDASLYSDYIFLDTDERRRFAQQSLELLVEQVQHTGVHTISSTSSRITLQFNHPVKELIWAMVPVQFSNRNGNFKYLWYHPKDNDALRLIATKRLALALARYVDEAGDELAFSNDFMEANSLLPAVGLPANLAALFNRMKPVAITTAPTVDNVSILGDLLTIEEISKPVAMLLDGFGGRPTSTDNHGSEIFDVVVRQPFNFGMLLDGTKNPLTTGVLQLNGHDRFSPREPAFFNYIQPLQHHSNTPADGINVYSFALSPEEHQPSGTLNFSRVDTSVLSFTTQPSSYDSTLYVFALSYNVLRVMSGMGGLAFSN